jgi:hypothetical protein
MQKDLAWVFIAVASAAIGCSGSGDATGEPTTPLANSGGAGTGTGGSTLGGGGSTTTGYGGTPISSGNGGYGNTPASNGGYGNTPMGNGGYGAGGTPPGNGGMPPGNGGTPPSGGMMGAGGTPPTGGAGGQSGSGAGGGSAGMGTPGQPVLPMAPANCPMLRNGAVANFPRASGTNVPVTIYIDPSAKSKPDPGGPLIIYWHATLSNPGEVMSGFGQANIAAVTAAGGVVAAPATTACSGCTTTDDGYWFLEDDVVADEIVACAVQQAKIDVTHIHTLGWSAGGLHTTHVAQARSNYIASFISYSGGLFPLPSTDQNPANKVAGILTYGDPGSDVVILDFNAQSQSWYKMFQPKGWYSMMCHHPGGHEVDPQIAPLSLRFFKDHPFEVNPEPYASAIPSGYPSYCSNMVH